MCSLLTCASEGSSQDAFRLAQLHFEDSNFPRAYGLLLRHDLITSRPECKYLAAHCHVKQGKFEEALGILGERTPVHVVEPLHNSRRKLASGDVHSRATAARHGKKSSKHEPNGVASTNHEADERNVARIQGGMSYLRGLCHAKLNAFDSAKQCYIDAVRIDVHCFEAFDQLMKNSLMSPEEEWEFLDSLDFESIQVAAAPSKGPANPSEAQQAAELTRMLYITRLSKFKNPQQFATAVETLSTHYNLSHNPDLLLARAELLFTQCRFRAALQLTTQILEQDADATSVLPIHLACLHELAEKNALFLLAHDYANRHPANPASWLAVGVYYLTIGKIADARRFFSKSSMMDPHFGPAWIGFAHTFAAEGEHDQAISAYSTAARLFQGTHLPQLFLGMQSLLNANMGLAKEFLHLAMSLCNSDPLLLNELGVVYYHEEQMERAIEHFIAALEIAEDIDADPGAYTATRINLGHAYRRAERWEEALECFEHVLRSGHGQRDAGLFCAKALVLLELAGRDETMSRYMSGPESSRTVEAIATLHEALAISPQDPVANELLLKALEESALETFPVRSGLHTASQDQASKSQNGGLDFDSVLEQRKSEAVTRKGSRVAAAKGKGKAKANASRSSLGG